MRTPALIFDFGNVVAFFDYGIACRALAASRGLDGAVLFTSARDAGLIELIKRYERGSIPAEEFSRACCRLFGLDVEHREFAAAWADIFRPNESIVPLIRALRASGYRLVLGSNTNDLHAAQFRRQFAETLGCFDRLVLSFEIGHNKPAPQFYLACADAAGASPADCIFIDDLPENIEGARRAGLIGIPYRDTPDLEGHLRRLGLKFDLERP